MAPECGLVQKHIFCVWCLYPLVFCIKENGRGKESIEVSTDVCASAVAVDSVGHKKVSAIEMSIIFCCCFYYVTVLHADSKFHVLSV